MLGMDGEAVLALDVFLATADAKIVLEASKRLEASLTCAAGTLLRGNGHGTACGGQV
jgi:hypothetical protein